MSHSDDSRDGNTTTAAEADGNAPTAAAAAAAAAPPAVLMGPPTTRLPSSSSSSSSSSNRAAATTAVVPPLNFVTEWSVTRNDMVRGTPSRHDGVSFKDEVQFRAAGCTQIQALLQAAIDSLQAFRDTRRQNLGERLKEGVPRVQAISMVLFHRFFRFFRQI